jgi:hypothetical protein
MKKLIPVVLGVWPVALVGCTTTTTSTTERKTTARMDPTIDNTRTTNRLNVGPH